MKSGRTRKQSKNDENMNTVNRVGKRKKLQDPSEDESEMAVTLKSADGKFRDKLSKGANKKLKPRSALPKPNVRRSERFVAKEEAKRNQIYRHFNALSDQDLADELLPKVMEKLKSLGKKIKINAIVLGELIENVNGEDGFEEHTFLKFEGIKIETKDNRTFVIMQGDVCKLPNNSNFSKAKIHGIEIHLNEDRNIERIYFLYETLFELEEVKSNHYAVHILLTQIKIDQKQGKRTEVYGLLKGQHCI